MLTRRDFLASGTLALTASIAAPLKSQTSSTLSNLSQSFEQLEMSCGGRLGIAVLDTQTGQRAGHREDQRFAMCSTFKVLLTAAILQQVDENHLSLAHAVSIPKTGLVSHSPITGQHAGHALPIRDLCAAAMTQSDNTAANLLLSLLGGPASVTRYARSMGDNITRLDRIEPELNLTNHGELRDTTTPLAMLTDLQSLLLGKVLSPASRNQLTAWMLANTTGAERLRAHLPGTWRVADKTGSNGDDTSNDIGALFPPQHAPILVTAYLTACPGDEARRSAVLAQVGKLIADATQ
jgi:beta-lactamase class A